MIDLLFRRWLRAALLVLCVATAALPAPLVAQEEPPVEPATPLEAAATYRTYIPLTANGSTMASVPPSPLPRLVNPTFDNAARDGWTMLEGDVPKDLIYDPTQHPDLVPKSITSRPNLLWLGGIPSGTIAHRAFQTVQLPVDYNVRLVFDYLPQSQEGVCGRDVGGLYANGVLLSPPFYFCVNPDVPVNTWREGIADLSPFRGQSVTLEFRLTTADQHNSNLLIDNLQLCGLHGGLAEGDQCPAPGWQELGANSGRGAGISGNPGAAVRPAIAIGQVGRPYVAWADNSSGNYEIYVRRWNGMIWETVGSGSASGGGISGTADASQAPSIALAPDGMPWVAWHELRSGANNEIYVRRFDGASWVEAGAGSASGGGVSSTSGNSQFVSLAIDSAGVPYVAWHEVRSGAVGQRDVYVRRLEGASWVEVGAGSASGGGVSRTDSDSSDASLAIGTVQLPTGGTIESPVVAWSEDTTNDAEIYVRRFSGGAWVEVGAGSASGGGVSANVGRSVAPALAAAPGSRALWLAWSDSSSGNPEIYVRRFDGSSWVEAGSGSATGRGISRNDGNSLVPAVAISRSGRVYVAWRQSGFNEEIYAKVWTGGSWQSPGVTSASGSGVSNTAGTSDTPAVAVAPDGVAHIVWSDQNAVNRRDTIYIRAYRP